MYEFLYGPWLGLSGSCWRRPLLVLVPVVEDVKDVVEFEDLFRELWNSRVHATGACHKSARARIERV